MPRGNVSSSSAGGLVGRARYGSTITIENCYATGEVSASASDDSYAGGLVGYASYSSTITNCYATG